MFDRLWKNIRLLATQTLDIFDSLYVFVHGGINPSESATTSLSSDYCNLSWQVSCWWLQDSTQDEEVYTTHLQGASVDTGACFLGTSCYIPSLSSSPSLIATPLFPSPLLSLLATPLSLLAAPLSPHHNSLFSPQLSLLATPLFPSPLSLSPLTPLSLLATPLSPRHSSLSPHPSSLSS